MSSAPVSPIPAPAPAETLPKSLKDRLDRVHNALSEQRKRATRASRVTIVVGVIVIALLSGYFAYGYSQFAGILQPKNLADAAAGLIESNVPELRKTLEAEVKKSAPGWAEKASQEAQEQLPGLREKLEDYAIDQIDGLVSEATLVTERQFRSYLQDNRALLERDFRELSTSPELAEGSLAELQASLDRSLRSDMQTQARDLFEILMSLNLLLEKLHSGRGLNKEEHIERTALTIIRRLQLEQADPSLVGKPISTRSVATRRRPVVVPQPAVNVTENAGSGKKEPEAKKELEAKNDPKPADEKKKDETKEDKKGAEETAKKPSEG